MSSHDEHTMQELPSIPSRCHWEGCDEYTEVALEVALIPNGSRVVRAPRRVPLCDRHRSFAKDTGRIRLAYHPDDTRPVNTDDQPYEGNDPSSPVEEKTPAAPKEVVVYKDADGTIRVR